MPNILDIPETSEFNYDPENLLDAIIKHLGIRNDAALSRRLEVAPPVVSKIRHRILPIGATLLIRIHEETGWTIKEIRSKMGDNREKFRIHDLI
ncbi:hypothetical protein H8K33_12940 [Undibacterium amnicola]|uniref:XRE family transcriptional regulator n=1 Tax=Undibacterium amnicola TaxID=1834038 RepID=A0ABR6XSF9_9BURK|nr:hypothetical protein [Undibacterium amnicola]MBC3832405.1 hypothetical protein [Undibacterium amnicola]